MSGEPLELETARVAVIVAHPDDETIWAGGLLLAHLGWDLFIATLSRASDGERAPKFFRVLERLGAEGAMADLDDGPEQAPLVQDEIQATILSMLPQRDYDLVLTHGPRGEYTRHLRHEETCRAVIALWKEGIIRAKGLWMFAYEDGGGQHLPKAEAGAHLEIDLSEAVWNEKRALITSQYGFAPESWEARAAPRKEAFWWLASPDEADEWLRKGRISP